MGDENLRELDDEAKIMNVRLRDLEKTYKLPSGYMTGLRAADTDWDFVVKIGLVLEGIVVRALALERGHDISHKNAAEDSHFDRLKSAKKLGLINKPEFKMLSSIAQMRNSFVHRLENLTRPFAEYWGDLTPNRRMEFTKNILSAGIPGSLGHHKDPLALATFPEDFRKIVLLAIFPTLIKLGYSHGDRQRAKQHQEWRAKQETIYGQPLPPQTEMYILDRAMVLELVAGREASGNQQA